MRAQDGEHDGEKAEVPALRAGLGEGRPEAGVARARSAADQHPAPALHARPRLCGRGEGGVSAWYDTPSLSPCWILRRLWSRYYSPDNIKIAVHTALRGELQLH